MLKLYDCLESGNGHKVHMLLKFLDRAYEFVDINIHRNETRTPEFLKLNPMGKIPVLELEDGRTLAESNAILCYLADGTDWFPDEPYRRAEVLSWLFWEQYSHEPNVAVARFFCHHMEMTEARKAALAEKREKGNIALSIMEKRLSSNDGAASDWLSGDTPTIADIACFAYTSVAEEGGFELARYPAVQAWIERIESLPRFVPMTDWETLKARYLEHA